MCTHSAILAPNMAIWCEDSDRSGPTVFVTNGVSFSHTYIHEIPHARNTTVTCLGWAYLGWALRALLCNDVIEPIARNEEEEDEEL